MNEKKSKYYVISVVSFVVFLLIWELATDVLHLMPPTSLPSPTRVVTAFIDKLTNPRPDGGTLFQHIWASLKVALSGFAMATIIGIPLGIIMGWSSKADLIIRPIFNIFRTVPGLSWVSIMVLFFGVGLASKTAIVFMVCIVPTVINTYSGIKNVSPVHLWVAQTFGATNNQLLIKIALPSSMGYIFTGLRQSLNMAWVSLVAAELVGASLGLGYMIQKNRDFSNADLIIVGMLTIGAIGTLMSIILQYVEDKFVKGGN